MNVFLFVPCLAQDLCPEVVLATAAVLEQAGFDLLIPRGHTCCGQPLYKQGRFQRAAVVAKQCIEAFDGSAAIVSPSASCVAMIKAYPRLFRGEPRWEERARNMAARSFELCEFLDSIAVGFRPVIVAEGKNRLLYHDSCQSRSLGVSDSVRRCMKRVPGLELVEFEESAACCGFGGGFSMTYPEISGAILEDKIAAVERLAGRFAARQLMTAEVSCLLNLRAGLRARGSDIAVLHAAQILAGEPRKEPSHV